MADNLGNEALEVARRILPQPWQGILGPNFDKIDWKSVFPGGTGSFVPKIRVTTEELQRKADEVDTYLTEMERSFSEMAQMMQRTSGYWIGEAGEKYRNDYKKQDEEIRDIVNRLRRFPRQLREIAGVYQTTENTNQSTAQALPADVL